MQYSTIFTLFLFMEHDFEVCLELAKVQVRNGRIFNKAELAEGVRFVEDSKLGEGVVGQST